MKKSSAKVAKPAEAAPKASAAKKSKAAPAPAAPAPKADPAAKAAETAKSAKPVKTVKAIKTPKVAKSAPAPKPVPAAPAPAVKTPKVPAGAARTTTVATTIVAAVDVGFGNHLTLRGQGPGLSWEVGVPLECIGDDRWSITLPEVSQPVVCKFLLNDQTWCAGEDYIVLPGSTVVLSPLFTP